MRTSTACCLGTVALAAALAGVVSLSGSADPMRRTELADWVAAAIDARAHPAPRSAPGCADSAGRGNAFDAYGAALRALRSLGPGLDERARAAVRAAPEARDPDPQVEPALQELSRGARMAHATWPLDLEKPLDEQVAHLLEWRTLTNVACAEVRRRAAVGDSAGAVALGLDTLTLATDVLRAPLLIQQMIGCALVAIATDQAFDNEVLSRLDEDDRRTLAAGIAVLDGSLRTWCDGRAEALVHGYQALGPDGSPEAIAVAHELATFWDRVASNPSEDLDARQAQLDALAAAYDEDPLATVAQIVPNCERMMRQAIARLRLLRLVATPAEDAVPNLADPLAGGPIRVDQDADGGFVYRAGQDPEAENLTRRVVRR